MTYKSIVVKGASKAKEVALAVESKSNEMASQGYELVTMSITDSDKTILVFKLDENTASENTENAVIENTANDSAEE